MRKRIILIVVICVFINNLVMANGGEASFDASSLAIKSAFSQVCSVLGMPIQIMNNIVKDICFYPEFRLPAKDKCPKKTGNTRGNKCVFLMNPSKSKSKLKINPDNYLFTARKTIQPSAYILAAKKLLFEDWTGWAFVLILKYIVSLSKSNVPGEINGISLPIIPNCPLWRVIGFFNFSQPNAGPPRAGGMNAA